MADLSVMREALRGWPNLQLLGPLEGGNRQLVWAARLREQSVVVHRSSQSPESLAWEFDLRHRLRLVDVHTPDLLRTTTGELHAGNFFVEAMVPGHVPVSDQDWAAVRLAVDRLHAATVDHRQRPGSCAARDLIDLNRSGDVRLDLMPTSVVRLLRAIWQRLPTGQPCVIHADLTAANLRVQGTTCILLDWAEARRDTPLLDLISLPGWEPPTDRATTTTEIKAAELAWEVAASWQLEPTYAKLCLSRLLHLLDGS